MDKAQEIVDLIAEMMYDGAGSGHKKALACLLREWMAEKPVPVQQHVDKERLALSFKNRLDVAFAEQRQLTFSYADINFLIVRTWRQFTEANAACPPSPQPAAVLQI